LPFPSQVFDTSDLPGGVVNILSGGRDHITKYLTEHQDVDAMWYFGTAEVRRLTVSGILVKQLHASCVVLKINRRRVVAI